MGETTSDVYSQFKFCRYTSGTYNTLHIDGRNGVAAICVGEGLKFQVIVSDEYMHPMLEYVRVKGVNVWKPVSLNSIYSVKKVKYEENARVEYLVDSPVPGSYFDFPFPIENCRYFYSLSYLSGSRIDRDVLDFGRLELSSTNYTANPNRVSLSSTFQSIKHVKEVRMPKMYDRCTVLSYFINSSNIRRIVFQPGDSLANCRSLAYFANSCYSLEELVNLPEDLGKNAEYVDCVALFSNCYSLRLTALDFPYAKLRRISLPGTDAIRSVPIGRLVFHPDSPFDQKDGANHINIKYCRFGREGLVELFELLPDFSGETTRQIDITGNPGAEELTDENRQIATNKNWIIVG